MAALLSISSSMSDDYLELEENERIDGLQRIKRSCTEINHLLEHLLEWTRLQGGHVVCSPVIFDLYTVALEMIAIIKTASDKKQIMITQSLPCKSLVKADRNMIGTVLRNLLFNAIKFSPRGSEISIHCHLVKSDENSWHHQVTVEDRGIGMNSDQINNLFHIGKSFSTRGTENEHGTGLGLFICKDLVELNGGKIHVESEPGIGSRFIFSLPSSNGDTVEA
jgi:signal transduction histidine kinase